MRTYSCSGTLGDTYITLCILYNIATKESILCRHYTTVTSWQKLIQQMYSLLPKIQVEFTNKRDNSYPRIHSTFACQVRLGKELSNPNDWCVFPKFIFPVNGSTLPNNYIVLNPESGKPQEHRNITRQTIEKIIKISNQPIILIGNNNQYANIMGDDVINLIEKTSLLEAMGIVGKASKFIGFQGLMAFVAMSHRIYSEVYAKNQKDLKAIKTRTHDKWKQYCDIITEG